MKLCLYCGKELVRPRWKNGNLDSTFHNRKFCSSKCYGKFIEAQGTAKRTSARKTAQRRVALTICDVCGSMENLQRHHKDRNPRNNAIENIQVLCQECHKNDHMADGTWGLAGFKNRIFQGLQQA